MDALDVKMLSGLRSSKTQFDPFPTSINSLRRVGNELGIDKDTVRKRLTKLKTEGAFHGWSGMINPNLLSLKIARVWLEFPTEDSKEMAIKELSDVNNVRMITSYLWNFFSFVFVYKKSQTLKDQLIKLNKFGHFKQYLRMSVGFSVQSTSFAFRA